jgi:hypothetical protein
MTRSVNFLEVFKVKKRPPKTASGRYEFKDNVKTFPCMHFSASSKRRAAVLGSLASSDQLNPSVFEVAAEACCVYAMLREEFWADENYWDVVGVAGAQDGVVINVHFLQAGA